MTPIWVQIHNRHGKYALGSSGAPMKLRRLDLNLIVILDTLLAEQNVTRAAERLGLSQSAVSHALSRLRLEFGDELLTRGGKGMEPTRRATQIRDKLRTTLAELETVLESEADFVPERSTRRFNLRVSDYVSDHLLADICTVLRAHAPGVRLHVNHFRTAGSPVLDDEIHVRLASDLSDSPELRRVRVVDDAFSVLMRTGHPEAGKPLTLERYLTLAHLKVSASAVGGNMIDEALTRRGLTRGVIVQLPSWGHAGPIVRATDLVVATPRHWTTNPIYRQGYHSQLLPLEEVRLAIDVIWRQHFDDDPGHRWMRDLIIAATQPSR
jgi:DNA-binding transcriptional LysR family regulator